MQYNTYSISISIYLKKKQKTNDSGLNLLAWMTLREEMCVTKCFVHNLL